MTKPWIDDEVTVSVSSPEQLQNSLSVMASTILNNTKAQHPPSSTQLPLFINFFKVKNQPPLNNVSKQESFYSTKPQPTISTSQRNVGPRFSFSLFTYPKSP